MNKTALYIGRFQPFHLGHADAIDQIFEDNNIQKLYIGIGSAEDNYTPQNPLTAGERMQIIEEAMKEKNIPAEKFAIIPIRNINHYALWPQHVQQYLPPINILYSGSPLVRQLWSQAFPKSEVRIIQKTKNISGTKTRQKIQNNQETIHELLSSTQSLINRYKLSTRLQNMSTS